MRRGLGGLGNRFGLIHEPVESGIVKIDVLEIRLFAEPDVDRDHLDVELLFPFGRHVGRAVRHDPQHGLISFEVDVEIADLVTQRQQRSVIQALDRALAPSHDLADFRIRHILYKLQDEQGLSF